MNLKTVKTHRAFLVGLREDGSPTCHPMVAIDLDGTIAFNTYRKSAKAQNFRRDPRAAVALLQDWQAPPHTRRNVTGFLEEMDPPATNAPGESSVEVQDATARRRGNMEKRMYLRLRTER